MGRIPNLKRLRARTTEEQMLAVVRGAIRENPERAAFIGVDVRAGTIDRLQHI